MSDILFESFESGWTDADRALLRQGIEELPAGQHVSAATLALAGLANAANQVEPAGIQSQSTEVAETPVPFAPKQARRLPDVSQAELDKEPDRGTSSRDSIGQYLHEIGLTPLLNAAQERELAQTIAAGRAARAILDKPDSSLTRREVNAHKRAARQAADTKDYFIRANLRLVVSIARRYPLPPKMELLDLIQEGNLGLEHAVDKFDGNRGFKFSTYATFWIRQSIGRALDQKANLIRLPGDQSGRLRAALRTANGDGDELESDSARLHRLTTPVSLNQPIGETGEQELGDLLPDTGLGPEDAVLQDEQAEYACQMLDLIENERDRAMVSMRFGMSDGQMHSFKTIGRKFGVSGEAARRIVGRALKAVKATAEQRVIRKSGQQG